MPKIKSGIAQKKPEKFSMINESFNWDSHSHPYLLDVALMDFRKKKKSSTQTVDSLKQNTFFPPQNTKEIMCRVLLYVKRKQLASVINDIVIF